MNREDCLSGNEVDRYVKGPITAEEQDRIEEHIRSCSKCFRRVIGTLKGTGLLSGRDKEDFLL